MRYLNKNFKRIYVYELNIVSAGVSVSLKYCTFHDRTSKP